MSSLKPTVGTGTPEFAAALLTDLYVRLRRDLQRWAIVTHQTPQPRMGYVGQHLVSVVTGFPGGRSGARGDDLKLPGGKVAEIKCCYRVDQLGECGKCGSVVASVEKTCPNPTCAGATIVRKDDSKWLITPKSEQELRDLFDPVAFYLVLFEFTDISKAEDIDVQILRIDPRSLGFALCMIDYYFNIRAHSASSAPFNLWPHSAKLLMMKPDLIYWAVIRPDDSIETKVFPGRDRAQLVRFGALDQYAGSDTLCEPAIDAFASSRGIALSGIPNSGTAAAKRRAKLAHLQSLRSKDAWDDLRLADDLARAVYKTRLAKLDSWVKEFAPTL